MASSIQDPAEIGARIALARETLGLTQADVARDLGLDRTAVVKMEAGRRRISATELVALAEFFNRPIDWFVTESPPSVVSRRNDPAVGGQSVVLDLGIERLARDVDYLEREQILPPVEPPRLDMPSTLEEAASAAQSARGLLSLESGPLLDLQRHAETLGLLTVSVDLGEDGRDAAYVATNSWGVALINGWVDPGRRRFNLAHELGHHLFADAYAPDVTLSTVGQAERLINAFAAHFLMPASDVQTIWHDFEDQRLAGVAIAVRFRTSWTAVCSHLKSLDCIDTTSKGALVASPPTAGDFLELGERWVSELDPPAVPPDYGRRVIDAFRNGKLTAARTTELLWGTVSEEDLPPQREIPLDGLLREFDPLP